MSSTPVAVTQHPLYAVFADVARKRSVDDAAARFSSSLDADLVGAFRAQLDSDRRRVQEGGPAVIAATKHDWYPGPLETDRYWPSLVADFQDAGWDAQRIAAVDGASTKVVAHTPKPDRPAWDAKGLVVGFVQSGKTTNFTSVIAKLADVDYRMVVVLSGIHNGLRKQTQARMDAQLKDLNEDAWFPLTTQDRDFHIPAASPAAYLSGDKVVLAVVKKNVAVLRRLIKWLDTPNGRQMLRSVPVVVIDDEADQASVATAQINPLIRRLLGLLPRCTYIGYTATPFANVFIDPSADDLYPKDFILNLPRPDDYFGPEAIFGRDVVEDEEDVPAATGSDMIRYVPDEDVDLLRPTGRDSSGFVPTMTSELVDAVRWFLLATAARSARGDDGHASMLIHTSVKTSVHESYKAPLQDVLAGFRDALSRGDVEQFRNQWEDENAKVPASRWGREPTPFEAVAQHLPHLLDEVRIVLDNSRSQDRLVYGEERVVAIAVGGNTLSRGLTLEGLVASLFVRGASAYDTLLQMGRWFGYRIGYEDLPRIWTTRELADGFRHLASVEHEMRTEIEAYQLQNLTPRDVAVRIKTHPSLQITSKMGAARPAYISYAGRRLQTRYFLTGQDDESRDWLGANRTATAALLESCVRYGKRDPENSSVVFRDVPFSLVTNFFRTYQVHEDSPDLDTDLMVKYIEARASDERPTLTTWSVAVVEGDGEEVALGPETLRAVVRSRVNADGNKADIKTLMSKHDRVLDLPMSTAAARGRSEAELVNARNDDEQHRDRGLLVVYPIDRTSNPQSDHKGRRPLAASDVVVGVGVVFPGDPETKRSVQPRYVAVDLAGIDVGDDDMEALLEDTEGSPA